jgi:uncharacterized protein YjbJ (UPF0337 family)
MSLENKAKATAKNIEGKVQESVGDVTEILKLKQKAKQNKQKLKFATQLKMSKMKLKKILNSPNFKSKMSVNNLLFKRRIK